MPLTLKAAAINAASDTTANWNLHPLFVPMKGQLIVYTDYKTTTDEEGQEILVPGIKIGDGKAYLRSLPFLGGMDALEIKEELDEHIADTDHHVTPEEKNKWNNKLNYTVGPDGETLILTRE